jgi:hypothetical protein
MACRRIKPGLMNRKSELNHFGQARARVFGTIHETFNLERDTGI